MNQLKYKFPFHYVSTYSKQYDGHLHTATFRFNVIAFWMIYYYHGSQKLYEMSAKYALEDVL